MHYPSGQLLLGGDWGGGEGDEEGGISGSQRVLKVRVLMTGRDMQESEINEALSEMAAIASLDAARDSQTLITLTH